MAATFSSRSLSRWTWYSRNRYAKVPLASSSDTAITATNAAIRFERTDENGRRTSGAAPPGRRGFAGLGLHELVADTPHGLNARRALAQLLAQPRDMDVDGARIAVVVVPPGQLEQPFAVEHYARVARQRGQQLEL